MLIRLNISPPADGISDWPGEAFYALRQSYGLATSAGLSPDWVYLLSRRDRPVSDRHYSAM